MQKWAFLKMIGCTVLLLIISSSKLYATMAPPNTPSDLTANPLPEGDAVELIWQNNSAGETDFIIERSTNGGPFVEIADDTASTFIDFNVLGLGQYTYRVKARNNDGESAYSNEATIELALLPAIGLVEEQVEDTMIVVGWTDGNFPNNQMGDQLEIAVERSINDGAFVEITRITDSGNEESLSYQDRTVNRGNQYAYRIVNSVVDVPDTLVSDTIVSNFELCTLEPGILIGRYEVTTTGMLGDGTGGQVGPFDPIAGLITLDAIDPGSIFDLSGGFYSTGPFLPNEIQVSGVVSTCTDLQLELLQSFILTEDFEQIPLPFSATGIYSPADTSFTIDWSDSLGNQGTSIYKYLDNQIDINLFTVGEVSSTQTMLSWTYRGDVMDSFNIERKTADGAFNLIALHTIEQLKLFYDEGGMTFYLDDGLIPGETYTYRVQVISNGQLGYVTEEITISMPLSSDFRLAPIPSILAWDAETNGIAWGDYNNDGFDDIAVLGFANQGREFLGEFGTAIFLNDNGSDFHEVSAQLGIAATRSGRGGSWGDVNNDGWLDFYLTNENDGLGDQLYFNNGGTGFTLSDQQFVDQTLFNGNFTGQWIDWNQDGYLDVVTSGLQGNYLYISDEGTSFIPQLINQEWSWTATLADFNGDTDPDLYLPTNSFEINGYYENVEGELERKVEEPFDSGLLSRGSAAADYDNDGDFDLFVPSQSDPSSNNRLYQNDGDGNFVEIDSLVINEDRGTRATVWADFNNDGYLDLFTTQFNTSFLYYSDQNGNFIRDEEDLQFPIVSFLLLQCTAAAADYDNDGDQDLMIGNSNFPALLWENIQENDNHFLQVKLEGQHSNKAGIGAKVSVSANGMWQTRYISGQTGVGGQNSLKAHFGLGEATSVDSIVVTWPSRIVQRLGSTAGDQMITIEEPIDPDEVTGIVELEALPFKVYPNPSNGFFKIQMDAIGTFDYQVSDIQGRLVLEGVGMQTAALLDIQQQPQGLYFLKLTVGDKTYATRLLKR